MAILTSVNIILVFFFGSVRPFFGAVPNWATARSKPKKAFASKREPTVKDLLGLLKGYQAIPDGGELSRCGGVPAVV